MSNIGALMAGSAVGKQRDPYDFNPTPPAVPVALARHYRDQLSARPLWDPSCGEGDLLRGFASELPNVTILGSDIYHRGFGMGGVSFLDIPVEPFKGKVNIVQNPPFNIALKMLEKTMEFEPPFAAFFLKCQFWNVARNLPFWERHPPKAIHPLTWRPDFTGQGRSTMDMMWCVWGDDVPFSNQPLRRP